MAYTYDPIFAADPNNPATVAKDATITIFDPADAAKAPVAITDPTGSPLANPLKVNAAGFGPAFQHPTLARVGWMGAGFVGYFTSYEGMLNETVAAKASAQAIEARANAGEFRGTKGDKGDKGDRGIDGANVLPTDTAIKQAIENPGSATRAALNSTFAPPQTSTCVIIGPSLEEQNAQGSDTLDPVSVSDALRARGWFHWMNGYLGAQGKGLKLLRNSGVGGQRWDEMLARFQTDVLAYKPNLIIIGSPTNDIGAGRTFAQITADGAAMISLARSIGARVAVHMIAPRSNVNTTAKRAIVDEVNRWIGDLAFTYPGVVGVDTWTPLLDPATGWPVYGTTLDGTHYSIAGAARIGKATADAVAPLIAVSRPPLTSFSKDARRAIDNPAFLNNGSGWASASGGATITYTTADRGNGNKAVIDIVGNAALTTIRGITRTQYAEGFVTPGDILQASVRVKWSGMTLLGGSTPGTPVARVQQLDIGGNVLKTSYSLYSASSEWEVTYPSTSNTTPMPMPSSGEMLLTTFRMSVDAACVQLRVYLGWIGAANAHIEFSDFALLKDSDATVARPTGDPYVRPAVASPYVLRWEANELAVPDGTTVTSWPDSESGYTLTNATTTARPVVRALAGKRVVEYDGVDDYLYNTAVPAYRSRAVVARIMPDAPATNQGLISSGSSGGTDATHVGMLRLSSSGRVSSYYTGSRSVTGSVDMPIGKFVVLIMRNASTDARTELNGTQSSVSTATATTDQMVAVEQGRRTTSYGRIQVAADICFPSNLTNTEMAAVLASLQSQHAALLAL
jgi:lysophospholipase L1-like esterase